jgi:hypothetical protein
MGQIWSNFVEFRQIVYFIYYSRFLLIILYAESQTRQIINVGVGAEKMSGTPALPTRVNSEKEQLYHSKVISILFLTNHFASLATNNEELRQ